MDVKIKLSCENPYQLYWDIMEGDNIRIPGLNGGLSEIALRGIEEFFESNSRTIIDWIFDNMWDVSAIIAGLVTATLGIVGETSGILLFYIFKYLLGNGIKFEKDTYVFRDLVVWILKEIITKKTAMNFIIGAAGFTNEGLPRLASLDIGEIKIEADNLKNIDITIPIKDISFNPSFVNSDLREEVKRDKERYGSIAALFSKVGAAVAGKIGSGMINGVNQLVENDPGFVSKVLNKIDCKKIFNEKLIEFGVKEDRLTVKSFEWSGQYLRDDRNVVAE